MKQGVRSAPSQEQNDPLKTAWKKTVSKYTPDNIGKSVTKRTFAQVFKEAWLNTIKLLTPFAMLESAWPVDPDLRESKVSPSTFYHDGDNTTDEGTRKCQDTNLSNTIADKPSKLAMKVMEAALTSPT